MFYSCLSSIIYVYGVDIMKKRYLLLIIILLFPTLIFASTNTKPREGVDNYGVTKYRVTEENVNYVLKTPYVEASEKIYDFSDILTEEEEIEVLNKIKDFKDRTNFDVVILTYDLVYYNDKENEDFAADFYDFNDFSRNGVLLFRNTYASDRYFDIYTFGEAQLYFYDTRLSAILDDIYDDISSDNYMSAIDLMMSRLDHYYSAGKLKGYFVDNDGFLRNNNDYYLDKDGKLVKRIHYFAPVLPALGISAVITAIVMAIMVSKNKMIRVATKATEYVDRKSIKYEQNEDKFITTNTTRTRISSSSSGGGGGHSSFGGHSGGGHSSGGGRHG